MKNIQVIKTSFSYRHSILLVLFAGVLWSTIGIGIRLIDQASVWQILLYRSLSLSIFLYFTILILFNKSPIQLITQNLFLYFISGLSLFGAYSGGIYAIQNTSVANVMLLFASSTFITAILGRILLKEKLSLITFTSIIFAILGVIVMFSGISIDSGDLRGNLSALASALGFSIFTLSLRFGKSGEMLPAVLFSGIIGVIISIFICLSLGLKIIISSNDMNISLLMGVFQVGAGLVLYTLGSKVIKAAELNLLALTEVLLGPFWVWVFLGEKIEKYTIMGGGILLIAILFNSLLGKKRN